jgi:hypothetical protein
LGAEVELFWGVRIRLCREERMEVQWIVLLELVRRAYSTWPVIIFYHSYALQWQRAMLFEKSVAGERWAWPTTFNFFHFSSIKVRYICKWDTSHSACLTSSLYASGLNLTSNSKTSNNSMSLISPENFMTAMKWRRGSWMGRGGLGPIYQPKFSLYQTDRMADRLTDRMNDRQTDRHILAWY